MNTNTTCVTNSSSNKSKGVGIYSFHLKIRSRILNELVFHLKYQCCHYLQSNSFFFLFLFYFFCTIPEMLENLYFFTVSIL